MAQVMTSQWLMSVGNKLTRPSIRFGGAWAYGTLAGRSRCLFRQSSASGKCGVPASLLGEPAAKLAA